MGIWLNILIDSIAYGATFMYGSTGEIITEKSGHLNLGIPGIMCMGGAGGCLMLNLIGKSGMPGVFMVLLGIIASFFAASLMGLIYSFLTITLRCNQNVTGLALTTFGTGLMMTLMAKTKQTQYLNIPKKYFRFPFADRTDSLQKIGIMFFLVIIIVIVAWFILNKTKIGLNLKAVGENPATADAAGINVIKYKYVATVVGAGISGLGGLYYILDYSVSGEAYKSREA